jgi:hypothetical protein
LLAIGKCWKFQISYILSLTQKIISPMHKLLQSNERLHFLQNRETLGRSTSQEHSHPMPSDWLEDKHNLLSDGYQIHFIRLSFNNNNRLYIYQWGWCWTKCKPETGIFQRRFPTQWWPMLQQKQIERTRLGILMYPCCSWKWNIFSSFTSMFSS